MVRLDIDGLEVVFPFPSAYPEQIDYMEQIKLSLDASGPALLEMPSGTGKTVCLLSLIIAYMSQVENTGPLIYCTRTIPEMNQGTQELRNVHRARLAESGLDYDKNFLGILISSRVNLCVLPEVAELSDKADVDVSCRSRTVPYSEERCSFFDHVLMKPRPGVYGLAELKAFGVANGLCPYFLARRLVQESHVIMCSFAYILDPAARELLLPVLTKSAIVVFDEAHNIDDVCCEYMSAYVTQRMLDNAIRAVSSAEQLESTMRADEQERLGSVLEQLRQDIERQEETMAGPDALEIFRNTELPEHIMRVAMPPALSNFAEFIGMAKDIVRFFVAFLQGREKPGREQEVAVAMEPQVFLLDDIEEPVSFIDNQIDKYTVPQVLEHIRTKCGIATDVLKFMNLRFQKFLTKNRIPNLRVYMPLLDVLRFLSLIATYDEGYCVFVERTPDGPTIQLSCVDCSIAFKSALSFFNRVIVTSGTLSPLNMYPLLLNFEPVTVRDFTMSLSRECLLPLFVTKGDGGGPVSSSFALRSDPRVSRSYGNLLVDCCRTVPDGIVCFFPSYVYMQMLFKVWLASDVINTVMKYKLVFMEAEYASETSIALENYKRAIESGRGAVFFGVARGRVSEGIDFSDHYGRCVLLFGLPVRNTQSMIVQTRADYIEARHGLPKRDFLMFDAMRAASQCVGRLLRSKNDYGIVILADRRYARVQAREQLPHWIRQFVDARMVSVSVSEAVARSRSFLLQMAQPFEHDPDNLIKVRK